MEDIVKRVLGGEKGRHCEGTERDNCQSNTLEVRRIIRETEARAHEKLAKDQSFVFFETGVYCIRDMRAFIRKSTLSPGMIARWVNLIPRYLMNNNGRRLQM